MQRKTKRNKSSKRPRNKPIKKPQPLHKKKEIESSDSDSDVEIKYADSDSDMEEDMPISGGDDLHPGEFVLVKYESKTTIKYYVGQFQKTLLASLTYEVNFLVKQKTKGKSVQFVYPDKEDIDDVQFEDIVSKLPDPTPIGGTERARKQFKFDRDLTAYV